MSSKKRTVSVWNACTRTFEKVEVTEEVYLFYRRSEWGIENQGRRVKKNEIPFSALKGGDGGAYENFSDFIFCSMMQSNPELELHVRLRETISQLSKADRNLLKNLFGTKKTDARCNM